MDAAELQTQLAVQSYLLTAMAGCVDELQRLVDAIGISCLTAERYTAVTSALRQVEAARQTVRLMSRP